MRRHEGRNENFWTCLRVQASPLSVLLFQPSHAAVSLLSGWVDVLTGIERQGYTLSLFCHLPPLALTGPNTSIGASTAQPINHCLMKQYKRKFAQWGLQTLSLFGLQSIYGPLLFSRLTWKDRHPCDEYCDVLHCINASDGIQTGLDLGVSSFFYGFIHRCLLSLLRNVSTPLLTLHT